MEKNNFLKGFGRVCWRAAFIGVELLAVAAVLLNLVALVMVWRLKAGPLDIGFARDYVEEALKDPVRGIYATMESATLSWPDLTGPIYLTLNKGQVFNAQNERIMAVDKVALSLSRSRLLIGQIAPLALVITKPTVELVRTQDGNLNIAWNHDAAAQATEPVQQETDLTTRILSYIAHPGNEANSSPLATLKAMEVKEARVNVEDQVLEASWTFPAVDALFKGTEDGLSAHLSIHPGDDIAKAPDQAVILADVVFPWDGTTADLNVQVKGISLESLARKIPQLELLARQDVVMDGALAVTLDRALVPVTGTLRLQSAEGHVVIPDVSDQPLAYRNFFLSADYDSDSSRFQVHDAAVVLQDIPLRADADIVLDEESVDALVHVGVDSIRQDQIGPLWPVSLKGDSSEEWIVKKLSKGQFANAFADMSVTGEKMDGAWSFSVGDITAGFDFAGMTVDYRSPLTPVTDCKGSGQFNYEQERLAVDVQSCALKDMTINKGSLEFIHIITPGAGAADIHVALHGPLQTAMTYVTAEPIAMNHGFDLPQIKGAADLQINLNFPTKHDLKMEQVKVDITGTASDIFIPKAAMGLDLAGGPFALTVKGNSFDVKGSGQLDGRTAFVAYQEFLKSAGQAYSSKAAASLSVDPNLRQKLGMDLSDFLEGSAAVDLTYTQYQDGRGEADIKADLKQARLFAEPFDYEKPAGGDAQTSFHATIKDKTLQSITDLTATAPGLTVEKSRFDFIRKGEETHLKGGSISRFVLGETVAKLDFDYDDAGRVKIVVGGPLFDLRPFLDNEGEKQEPYQAPPMQISLAADRLRTAEGEDVQYGKIYADIDGQGAFNQLEMDAIAGKGDIYLRYKPDASGKRVFRFEADDAGATLKAFDIYDNIIGGKLVMYAEPIKGVYDRNLNGLAEITDFKVVKAPVLAQLLNAMSIVGLPALLNNEGLTFTKLEAKFNWLYRQHGSLLVLKEGRTSGSSLGFTFDGTFDNAAGTIDVNGTMVPMSEVNKIIGSIPIVGDILTGGSGGVFAATYSIKGKGSAPEVSVNPLSVLTPGILRRILFEQN